MIKPAKIIARPKSTKQKTNIKQSKQSKPQAKSTKSNQKNKKNPNQRKN